jgi:hypothetical protein
LIWGSVCVRQAEQPGADEVDDHAADQVDPGQVRQHRHLPVLHVAPGIDHHEQDRQRFKCGEDPPDPQSVLGRSQPVMAVPRSTIPVRRKSPSSTDSHFSTIFRSTPVS